MSADLLREAAALMRERANDATYTYASHHPKSGQVVPWFEGGDVYSFDEGDGPHIMAWSPAVALAVADWLDHEADQYDLDDTTRDRAIAVARAYLGGDS